MTIETKYNIGDEVWFIWENIVQSAEFVKHSNVSKIGKN